MGDIYVGIVASVGALWLPPLLGGVVIILLLVFLVRVQRGFLRYDSLDPMP